MDEKVEVGRVTLSWSAGPDPLNRELLKDIRELQAEDEPDLLTELIDMYLVDSRVFLNAIYHHLQEGRLDEMQRSLHRLKGASANLGAVRLPVLCLQMEEQIDQGELTGMRFFLPELEAEYQRVCAALSAERAPRNEF